MDVENLVEAANDHQTNIMTCFKPKACWVCVILFAQVVVSECLHRARRGVRGWAARPPLEGCRGVQGQRPRIFFSGRHIFGMTYFRDDILLGRHISETT
jgi:hypothetical protein